MIQRLQLVAQKSFLVLLMMAVTVSSVISFVQSASAVQPSCDYEFYSANQIITYDPCAEACAAEASGSTSIDTSGDTAEVVYRVLTSTPYKKNGNKALTAVQAAGLLGNAAAESGVDPKRIQDKPDGKPQPYDESKARSNIGGYAFGLWQWDGGRRPALLKHADEEGSTWDDLVTQLNYLKEELDGGEGANLFKDKEFNTTTDPAVAAVRFRVVFERASIPHDEKRQKAAKQYYKDFKNITPGKKAVSTSSNVSVSNIKYIANKDIPLKGIEVGVSVYGGLYKDNSWYVQNGYQAKMQKDDPEKFKTLNAKLDSNTRDDSGIGNHDNPLHNTVSFAELNMGKALGELKNGDKIEVTYKGKSIIASREDIGGGGGDVKGKIRAVDLWWEAARILDFTNGTDTMKIRAVDPSTPTTPLDGGALKTGDTVSSSDTCDGESGSVDVGGNMDIVKTALDLAWPLGSKNNNDSSKEAKPEYKTALEKVKLSTYPYPVGIGASCDAYVATVMRYSGVDPDYHCCYANTQAAYMRKHPELYKELGKVTDTGDKEKLVPGAILWRDQHIKFYIGNGEVLSADASYGQRTAMQHKYLSLNDGNGAPYYSFVYIGPNKPSLSTEVLTR